MNYARLRLLAAVTLSLAIIAVTIRAIWQVVVIPTPGSMLVFLPLTAALLLLEAALIYLAARPEKLRSRTFSLGLSVALTAGLLAGVSHFVRFIISPQAEPALSKLIAALVLLASISAYTMILYLMWSRRKAGFNGQPEV
ncbi:MAG: hypothetical protein ABID71_09265 [Chloroflexota bacterium]